MVTRDAYRVWLIYQGTWGFVGALSWTTAAVYFIREVGMSPLELVLLGTALEVAYLLFEVPTGVLADSRSRKLSLVVASLVSGFAMLVTGLVPEFAWIAVAMAVWGFGWTFRSGAEDAWLADEVGASRLGAAYQRGAQVARVTGLLGIAASVALALVGLQLPFVAAGFVTLGLSAWIAWAMPEEGFTRPAHPPGTRAVSAMTTTLRQGGRLVRGTPVLLLMLAIFLFVGAWSEGFDRLWEYLLLEDVGLPDLGLLGEVGWFGVLGAATLVLSFAVAAPLVQRLEALSGPTLARALLLMHAALLAVALAFALAGRLWLALASYLGTTVLRELAGPTMRTWINQNITDSSVRATVLSITTVAESIGEGAGGPGLGALGNRFGVRTALAVGAVLLAPTLVLFGRAARHRDGRDPELTQVSRRNPIAGGSADPGPTGRRPGSARGRRRRRPAARAVD